MQAGANGSDDQTADYRWMSYGELAEARRITTSSAIKLVRRRGWRRQKDNHGIMRALVPPEWSEPAPGKAFDPGAYASQAVGALEVAVAALRERAEAAERATEIERQRADRAVQSRDAERVRANTLRDRIDALQAELVEAEIAVELASREAQQATETAEAFRQFDAKWRALGRLARIWQAWRGELG